MKTLFFLWILTCSAGAYWTVEIVDSGGSNTGSHCSLALIDNDTPCISYYSNDMNSNLMCASWTDSSWDITIADSLCEGVDTSLDAFGYTRHIAYKDQSLGHLLYAFWDGAFWSNYLLETPGNTGAHTAIRVDSFGNPHIVYDATNGTIRYAQFDGSTWQFETVSDPSHYAAFPDFILDDNDVPHIIYRNQTASDLIYTTYENTSWQSEVITNFCSPGMSIDLDSSGNPHVACGNYTTNANLIYAYYDGSEWQCNTVINGDSGIGDFFSLALNSSDEPTIVYYDQAPPALRYAFWSNGWHFEEIDSGDGVGQYCSHEIDSNDCAHIAYYCNDGTSSPELRYARWNVMGIESEQVSSSGGGGITLSCNPFSNMVLITVDQSSVSSVVTVHDITGHIVRVLSPGADGVFPWDGISSSGREVSSGMYFIHCRTSDQTSTASVLKI